ELLGLLGGALGLTPQYQPGHPARREGLARGLRHHRQGLASALTSGGYALRLADAAHIGGDAAIAPWIAAALELPEQLYSGVAARIPALEEIVFIGIEETAPIVAAMLPHRPRRHLQIPLDRATATPHLRRNRHNRPALTVQSPHLIVDGL